jgi:hypothetical protein
MITSPYKINAHAEYQKLKDSALAHPQCDVL